MATLYVVATPIGNLEDVTERARRVLGEVVHVLAEDTRRTGVLLRHLDVRTPMTSLHEHNEASRVETVLGWLDAGEDVALVSDAGTPLVSDPGARLLEAVVGRHEVVPVPGPSAPLAALVGSGLPVERFAFLGFVPRRGEERSSTLERVAGSQETTVLFESPERLLDTLRDLRERCGGERRAAVARELTKVHESFVRGTLAELVRYYQDEAVVRGEVTLVVAAAPPAAERPDTVEPQARALARTLLRAGSSPSRAAKDVARHTGIARNRAYELVQEVSRMLGTGDEQG